MYVIELFYCAERFDDDSITVPNAPLSIKAQKSFSLRIRIGAPASRSSLAFISLTLSDRPAARVR